MRRERTASLEMGPGQTADFSYVPTRAGTMYLETWVSPMGQRIALPVVIDPKVTMAAKQ
jgi:hypothetical protein